MTGNDNQFQGVVDSLLKGMDSVLSTKTVVGEAINIGDTIILPLVDVSFGVGAGAGSKQGSQNSASGAGGLGGKMTPSAVLVIKDGYVKLVNVKNQSSMTKALDMLPDLIDKLTKKDNNGMTDAEVVEVAFPEAEVE